MKRYGVLPPSFEAAAEPVNVYELDRRYWDLFEWTGAPRS